MRKIMQWMMAATLVSGISVFTSCSLDNDDNAATSPDGPHQQLADYTIIYYGNGGGDLDKQGPDGNHRAVLQGRCGKPQECEHLRTVQVLYSEKPAEEKTRTVLSVCRQDLPLHGAPENHGCRLEDYLNDHHEQPFLRPRQCRLLPQRLACQLYQLGDKAVPCPQVYPHFE